MTPFVERYQRLMAFAFPKKYKLVFTRSVDMVDSRQSQVLKQTLRCLSLNCHFLFSD
jgi:hypothetical protein